MMSLIHQTLINGPPIVVTENSWLLTPMAEDVMFDPWNTAEYIQSIPVVKFDLFGEGSINDVLSQ